MRVLQGLKKLFFNIRRGLYLGSIKHIPFLRPIYETSNNESPITFKMWFMQKILGFNRKAYWPVHFTSKIIGPQNIYVGIDAAPGISPGCYIQAVGKIYIGDYSQVAPNVSLISSNHFLLDIRKHIPDTIIIGKYCSIGVGSIVLPGVELGDFTFVGAGSVVTKSFTDGYCVIKGNPAEIVIQYDNEQRELFKMWSQEYKYQGYIPHHKFENFRKKYLTV